MRERAGDRDRIGGFGAAGQRSQRGQVAQHAGQFERWRRFFAGSCCKLGRLRAMKRRAEGVGGEQQTAFAAAHENLFADGGDDRRFDEQSAEPAKRSRRADDAQ